MTVFLCIMTFLAIDADPHVDENAVVPSTGAYALWVVLVLGLATMALVSYSL